MRILHLPQDDDKLIEGCLKERRAAQNALYAKYKDKMFGVCMRYAPNAEEAEDVLQEGFVKVFTRLAQFRGGGSFEGWLRRVFVHTAIERYRKRRRAVPTETLEDYHAEAAEAPWPDSDDLEQLLQLIRQLPEGCRAVFNLYVVEGYAHREIAEMLGVSEGTSRSQLNFARKKLADALIKLNPEQYAACGK